MGPLNFSETLIAFVTESNRIEGINRPPTEQELAISTLFLELEVVQVRDLENYVHVITRAPIRDKFGMDVRVGNHTPPRGGSHIPGAVSDILGQVNNGVHPYLVHAAYESLHPFMDGNGRSGRILWAWQMLHQEYAPGIERGFLWEWYYQSLETRR